MQVHHVSQILIAAHEPCLDGIDGFMERQRTIQEGIEVICGIGMTLTEDASSILSSQCLFIGAIAFFDRSLYWQANCNFSWDVHAGPGAEEARTADARGVPQEMSLAHPIAGVGVGADVAGERESGQRRQLIAAPNG
jgi:hypothetical protein